MATELKNASFRSKSSESLPKGANVISRDTNVEVEEIENGFLITKRTEIKYKIKDQGYNDYLSIVKKFFSTTNPLQVDLEELKPETLVDKF